MLELGKAVVCFGLREVYEIFVLVVVHCLMLNVNIESASAAHQCISCYMLLVLMLDSFEIVLNSMSM